MTDRAQIGEHLKFFGELGIGGISKDKDWRHRQAALGIRHSAPGVEAERPETEPSGIDRVPSAECRVPDPASELSALRTHIGPCTRCKLHALGRKQVVFGVGNPRAELMFVGEAPGADEDAQGEPFVGRAGQLLTKIIEAIHVTRDGVEVPLKREDVYIANVLKCRPPGNRAPEPDEVATCEPFLFRQIDTIRPRVIVALGSHAAHALLKTDAPISRLRGHVHEFRGGIKLIPTFHPAYLLRSPDRKRDVWEDMKKVRALLDEPA